MGILLKAKYKSYPAETRAHFSFCDDRLGDRLRQERRRNHSIKKERVQGFLGSRVKGKAEEYGRSEEAGAKRGVHSFLLDEAFGGGKDKVQFPEKTPGQQHPADWR